MFLNAIVFKYRSTRLFIDVFALHSYWSTSALYTSYYACNSHFAKLIYL